MMMKPRIAVIDDDPVILKLMNMLLTYNGYETILWSEAETACEMLRQQQPDLVTLDLSMQGDPDAGLKVIECLCSDPTTSEIPVIIVSSTADTFHGGDTRLTTLAYARLVKPVSFEGLLYHVATALQQAPTRSEAKLGGKT